MTIKLKVMENIEKNSNIHNDAGYTRTHARVTTLENPRRKPSKKSIENLTRHSEVSEKAIEKYLVEQAKAIGVLCLKYSNASMAGYPDRLVILPNCKVVWVELKSKGKKPTKLQKVRQAELTKMGHWVETIDSKDGIDQLIATIEDYALNYPYE